LPTNRDWPIRRSQKELMSTSRRIEVNRKPPLREMLMFQ
jgi:hypothetical protein